ncbi:MAG: hypothetical protein RIQ71_969 [Verrucomicrobiota bacterium]|jgi:hypothetical protein
MKSLHRIYFRRPSAHIEMNVDTEGGNTGAPTTRRDWLAPAIFPHVPRAEKAL